MFPPSWFWYRLLMVSVFTLLTCVPTAFFARGIAAFFVGFFILSSDKLWSRCMPKSEPKPAPGPGPRNTPLYENEANLGRDGIVLFGHGDEFPKI